MCVCVCVISFIALHNIVAGRLELHANRQLTSVFGQTLKSVTAFGSEMQSVCALKLSKLDDNIDLRNPSIFTNDSNKDVTPPAFFNEYTKRLTTKCRDFDEHHD